MTGRKLAFVALLVTIVAAFGFSGGRQEMSPAEETGPVTITYYLWDDPTYRQIVDAFNESQDRVFVDAQYLQAGDYEAKLTTLLAGGAEMDAFMQKRQFDMFSHYANGYIEPLDDLIAAHNYDTDQIAAYQSALQIDGTWVAVPFRGGSYLTYYNTKLFEAAGEHTPDYYVERGEWTWDKFEEVAERMATGDGEIYGGLIYTWGNQTFLPAIQTGAQFITADGQVVVDDSILESLRRRLRLEQSGAIPTLVDLKVTRTHYSQAFYNGNLAMMIIGEWFPGMMLKAREDDLLQGFTWDDWGVTRLPSQTPDHFATVGNPTFNHVHADSDKKDAAFEFIAWMGSAAGAQVVARAGFLPPVVDDSVRAILADAIPDEQSLAYFVEDAPRMPIFYNRYGTRIDLFTGELVERYMVGDIADADLRDEITAGLEEIVATTN